MGSFLAKPALAGIVCSIGLASAAESTLDVFPSRRDAASMLIRYFERICTPKPFKVREGEAFRVHEQPFPDGEGL